MSRRRPDPYRLVRYVALGAAEGIVAGWAIVLILVRLDIGGLGARVAGMGDGPLALLMLLAFFAITFGMVGIAWRVMVLLPDEPAEGDERRRR